MKLGPASLLWFVLLPTLSNAAPPAPAWHTYRSPGYGFSIRYPSTFRLYSGHPDYKEASMTAMVAVCDDTTVACFQYNVGDNHNTDFQAAGVSVNVLRERKSAAACYLPDADSRPLKIKLIHGIQFHAGETGIAAAGSSGGGDFYRIFHQDVCFEVTVNTSGTDAWIVADSGPRFSASKEQKIARDMDAMLQSFTFTGPVKDGAAWDVYRDSCCGVRFEFPRGDTVELTLDYDPHAPASRLESSQHFLHGGKDYTVAVKGGREDDLDAWLASAGYPALSSAQLLQTTEFCKEYRAGPYTYIKCENDLYILSVSDASHHAVSPLDDPVFTHLLDTFQYE